MRATTSPLRSIWCRRLLQMLGRRGPVCEKLWVTLEPARVKGHKAPGPPFFSADVAPEQHREEPAHRDPCAGVEMDVGCRTQTSQLLSTRSPAAYTPLQTRPRRACHGAVSSA